MPPVVLSRFTSSNRAANIPELVNAAPDAIWNIRQEVINDVSYVQAGKWNVRDGDYDLALRSFKKALEINPANVEARVAMGSMLVTQGRLDEAKNQLTKALAQDAANKDAYSLLGNLLEKQGKFSEAVETYRRALQVDPQYAPAHQLMGRLSLKMGATDEGRKHLRDAVRLAPNIAAPALGNSFLREQDTDQASVMYRKALERDSDSDAALLGLAMALMQDQRRQPRDIQEAVELAARACKLTDHKKPPALIVLADAYAASGRLPDAISVARKALDVAQQIGKPDLAATVRTLLQKFEEQMATREVP